MAELFTVIVSGLTGGGGAAAGATAGAGVAGGAAAGGLSFASIASGLSTVVGGLASIAAGRAEKEALYAQAADEESKAVQEQLNGRQEALTALRKLNQDLAFVTVAGYGSGLTAEGSIDAARQEAMKTGEQNISMARENANYTSAARRGRAYQLKREGRAAATGGMLRAVSGGLSMFSRGQARG